ncbi:acyltransferase domain protein [Mycobacterium xenopi 3993]|nr:acyltransferase domain protein [Mycobacterium xenopi 3993]
MLAVGNCDVPGSCREPAAADGAGDRNAPGRRTRSFLPRSRACGLRGHRVVVTHVAFQTGHSSGVDGRLFARFDFAVAVFFALSGFCCGVGTRRRARPGPPPATGHYLRSRVVRIMPGYVVAVVVILCLLPEPTMPA